MKFLILIADTDEFKPFKEKIKNLIKTEYKIQHLDAFDFSYRNHEVTAVCFGIGKVNAAIGATLALQNKTYDGIINTGWSGAVSGVKKGEIVVSDSCVECDFDLTPTGRLLGQKPSQEEYIYKCNSDFANKVKNIDGFSHGALGTGDFFLTDNVKRDKYKEIFNINAFDMESGALAATCYLLGNLPFVSIRKISDNADDVAVDEYSNSAFGDLTAFSDIILKVLENI